MLKRHILFLVAVILLAGCDKADHITADAAVKLSFSETTVLFDTLFTSTGSVTHRLKVYNEHKNGVRITEIVLNGGNTSPYQLNINGVSASRLTNVELGGNDSLIIFVKVTINPSAALLPFVVTDRISFLTNGNQQSVELKAYGQNARFLTNTQITQNTTWDNSLPYVIYGSVRVHPAVTLKIDKGCRIYFHTGAGLAVDGTLLAEGTPADSIVFTSDRREPIYSDEPGQWPGIHLTGGSQNNRISHVVIKNAINGVQVDSLSSTGQPKLILANSTIKNIQANGISGYKTQIAVFNSLLYNIGLYHLYGSYGGDYNIKHNTFVNTRARMAAVVFSDSNPVTLKTYPLNVQLVNNIIWGNLADELLIEKKGATTPIIVMKNNLLRSKNTALGVDGNILNTDPIFVNPFLDNFRLNASSPAANKGTSLVGDSFYTPWLTTDKSGKARIFPSDTGCYEIL